jgi:hypothetical protein
VASAAARELTRRLSGSLEVLLVWDADTDSLRVCVRDGVDDFQLEVGPTEAMDVFNHPFAYAAARGLRPAEAA